MVHSKKENRLARRLTVSRASKCITPPKLRVKRPVPSGLDPLSMMQNRTFKPLRVADKPAFVLVSPKRKHPRINQLTPKKVPSLKSMISKSSSSPDDSNCSAVPSHCPSFDVGFDDDCGHTSSGSIDSFTSFVDDELNDSSAEVDSTEDLAASIEHIENSQKIYLPLYLELLQWNPASFARITRKCYILQDWSSCHKTLKVHFREDKG